MPGTQRPAWHRIGLHEHDELFVFVDYVRRLADLIELRDWTFIVESATPETEDARAEITCLYGRKIGTLRFADGFRDEHPNVIRLTVTHELVHAHLDGMDSVIDGGAAEVMMGKPAYEVFYQAHKLALEYACDALADALAPGLPFIDWEQTTVTAPANLFTTDAQIKIHPYREEREKPRVSYRDMVTQLKLDRQRAEQGGTTT